MIKGGMRRAKGEREREREKCEPLILIFLLNNSKKLLTNDIISWVSPHLSGVNTVFQDVNSIEL